MMTLYSGTVDPYSHRCRIVLYEKGMDFQVIDVDLDNKPEDLAIINPHNEVPVLVERDLVLQQANIINEYIDERFPHPQLMPADPVMRARARLFLHNFEEQLFSHIRCSLSSSTFSETISPCWTWRWRRCSGVWGTMASSCPNRRRLYLNMRNVYSLVRRISKR
jgi:hypothetical protein